MATTYPAPTTSPAPTTLADQLRTIQLQARLLAREHRDLLAAVAHLEGKLTR